jgi:hypothetical protein
MPPSAMPGEIYDMLFREVQSGDHHSAWIAKNKAGILKGADCKREDGIITPRQKGEIASIVAKAEVRDFRPLLYIIPFDRIKRLVKQVPPNECANPLSIEYIIENLPRSCFDAIDLRR